MCEITLKEGILSGSDLKKTVPDTEFDGTMNNLALQVLVLIKITPLTFCNNTDKNYKQILRNMLINIKYVTTYISKVTSGFVFGFCFKNLGDMRETFLIVYQIKLKDGTRVDVL